MARALPERQQQVLRSERLQQEQLLPELRESRFRRHSKDLQLVLRSRDLLEVGNKDLPEVGNKELVLVHRSSCLQLHRMRFRHTVPSGVRKVRRHIAWRDVHRSIHDACERRVHHHRS